MYHPHFLFLTTTQVEAWQREGTLVRVYFTVDWNIVVASNGVPG
jgi:hypothetical protein